MAQPWDFWHQQAAAGYSPFNLRDAAETSAAVGHLANPTLPWMLTAQPFFVGDNGIFLRRAGLMCFNTSQPGNARLGVYACPPPADHNMYPSSLLYDLGEIVLTGAAQRYTADVPVGGLELAPGFYYLASVFSSTPAMYGQRALGGPGGPLGMDPSTGLGYCGFSAFQAYGALPATFPALSSSFFTVVTHVPTTANRCAIYVESPTALAVTVQYNAGTPAGTAVVVTDTAAAVTVNYNGASNATVAAALLSAVNITAATAILGANWQVGGFESRSTRKGPLTFSSAAGGDTLYMPLFAIDVE